MKKALSLILACCMLTASAGNVLAAEGEQGGPPPRSVSQSSVRTVTDSDTFMLPDIPERASFSLRSSQDHHYGQSLAGERAKAIYNHLESYMAGTPGTSRSGELVVATSGNYDTVVADVKTAWKDALEALILDRPELFFWVNKGTAAQIRISTTLSDATTVHEMIVELFFVVAPQYMGSKTGTVTDPGVTYEVYSINRNGSSGSVNREEEAKAKAKAIIDAGKAKATREETVRYYHDQIMSLTEYNTEAAAKSPTGYGSTDPWQWISVFLGEKVVCEGYSKAFKYLCDGAGIPCVLVTGDLTAEGGLTGGVTDNAKAGAGNHMWNEVQMDDGAWYLVDVTNDDGNGFGRGDGLFLIGSGSANYSHYTVKTGNAPAVSANEKYVYTAPKISTITITQAAGGTVQVTLKNEAEINDVSRPAGTEVKTGDKLATGTVVVIVRTPEPGSGYELDGFEAREEKTVTGDLEITAKFSRFCTVTINAPAAGAGTFEVKKADGTAVASGEKVPEGTKLSVTAKPGYGYKLTSAPTTIDVGTKAALTISGSDYFEKVTPPVLDSGYAASLAQTSGGSYEVSYEYQGAFFQVLDSGRIPKDARMKVTAAAGSGYTLSSIKAGKLTVSNDTLFAAADAADANDVIAIAVTFNSTGGGSVNPPIHNGGSGGSSGGSGGGGGSGGSSGGGSAAHSQLTGKINGILKGLLGGGTAVPGATVSGGGTSSPVTAAQAAKAAEAAVRAARASGSQTAAVHFANVSVLPAAAVRAVLDAAVKAGLTPVIHADTLQNGKVAARLYVMPDISIPAGDINPSMIPGNRAVEAHFAKYFPGNRFAVVSMGQKGSFGATVQAAVKVDLKGMDPALIVIYTYDVAANAYTRLENTAAFVDGNGFLHFNTTMGNEIVITDQAL